MKFDPSFFSPWNKNVALSFDKLGATATVTSDQTGEMTLQIDEEAPQGA